MIRALQGYYNCIRFIVYEHWQTGSWLLVGVKCPHINHIAVWGPFFGPLPCMDGTMHGAMHGALHGRAKIVISARGAGAPRVFSPARGSARGIAKLSRGRTRGREKFPRAIG